MTTEEREKQQVDIDHADIQHITLEDVTPKLERFWIYYPYLLQLNFLLLGGILSQIVCGYDGSSMVCWQNCHEFFF
jgi:hypothetical protein